MPPDALPSQSAGIATSKAPAVDENSKPDFAQYGEPVSSENKPDFAQYGTPVEQNDKPDFSQYGSPVHDDAPQLRAAEPLSLRERIGEALSPLFGPTERQKQEEGVTVSDGKGGFKREFKPAGSKLDQEGLLPSLSHPAVPIPRFQSKPDDSTVTAVAKGAANTAAGVAEFAESPLGVMTAGVGAAPKAVQRLVSAGYAYQMGNDLPAAAQRAGEASVTGNTQQKAEAYLGLGTDALFTGLTALHAVAPGKAEAIEAPLPEAPSVLRPAVDELPPPAPENAVESQPNVADQQAIAPEQPQSVAAPAPAEEDNAGDVDLFGNPIVGAPTSDEALPSASDASVPSATQTDAAGAPVLRVPAEAIATRPDLMQFKRMDDTENGVNANDQLSGKFDDLKAGNLLLFEPADPKAYGLEEGQKYIVANGHHRFDFGERQNVPAYNAQIIREVDNYSPQDARALAAEINIADGKGTIYDQTKFLRNEAAAHGTDAALARAERIGIRGRQAASIAFQAGPDLYTSFVNEQIKPGEAQAIAEAAPLGSDARAEGLQRLGIRKAIDGAGPQELRNLIQAVQLESGNLPPQQFDLFAADDTALKTAEQLASVATRLQSELSKEIRSTEAAAKNAATAKAKGISFDRSPEDILAENAKLKDERARFDHWALHPDLVAQVRGYAEMERAGKTQGKTIDQRLQALKLDTRGQLHAFGLVPELWNTLVDGVRLAVKGGQAVAEAVANALAKFKADNPQIAFDEAGARDHLMRVADQPERQFTGKLRQADDVAPEVKQGITNTTYERRTNENDEDLAGRILREQGVGNAIQIFANRNNELPGSVRGMLGQKIIKTLSGMGDFESAIEFHDNHFAEFVTDTAQTLQAQRAWMSMTPEGQVLWARKQIERAVKDALKPVQGDIDAAREALRKSNETGIRAATADPAVQASARNAVDERVMQSPEVRRGVVVEIAGALAESPQIVRQAREALTGQLDNILRKQGRSDTTVRSKQELDAILGDTAKRAAGIAAAHYQGAEPGKALAAKLQERLGLSEAASKRLAQSLDDRFGAMVKRAQDALPHRVAAMRAKLNRPFDPNEVTPSAIDTAIRTELRANQQTLGQLIHQHFTKADATAKSLTDKLVLQAGLSGEAAERLSKAVQTRFEDLTTATKRAALEKLLKPVAPRAKVGLVDRLLRLSNLGAFDNRTYYNAVKERLNLPEWTPELQRQLRAQADAVARIPEDQRFAWQKAQTEFMNTLERAKGFSWFDANHAFFITNLLTGLTTHFRVAIHTSTQLLGALSTEITRALVDGRAHDVPLLFQALAEGGRKALPDQLDILKTGMTTGGKVENVFAQKLHELSQYGTKGGVPIDVTRGNLVGRTYAKVLKAALEFPLMRVLNAWKYNDRLVTAQHVLYYAPAEEMKVALLTARIARGQGLRGRAATDAARQILGYGAEAVANAKAQAVREGYSGHLAAKRAGEILNARRPQEVTQSAKQYALRQTFLNKPYGFAGAMAEAVQAAKQSSNVELSRGAQIIAPFVRIAANLFNEGLNYTPVGALRARSQSGAILGMEDLSPADRRDVRAELLTKSALGTAVFGAIALKAASDLANPNPSFTLYGEGPSNPEDKARWRALGGIPFSVRVGNTFISYANTPANVFFGAVGNYLDHHRDALLYKRAASERVTQDKLSAAALAMVGAGKVIMEQPFLQSLTEMASITSEANPEITVRQTEKMLARTASSMVVPNVLRQIDRFGDPTVYDQRQLNGILTASVPFVRRTGQPVLNALGQPLQSPVTSMFVSQLTDDPLVKNLNRFNAWPTAPGRNSTLVQGVPLTDEEFYAYNLARGVMLRRLIGSPNFVPTMEHLSQAADQYHAQAATETDPMRAMRIDMMADKLPDRYISKIDSAASKAGAAAVINARAGGK